MWITRDLSLNANNGKCAVLKALEIPYSLSYIYSIHVYIEEYILKELENIFFIFLGSNWKHGINNNILKQNIDSDGLKFFV